MSWVRILDQDVMLEDLVHGNSWGQPIAHKKLEKYLAGE
ncbi:hypothetical protein DET64_104244 [Marinobacter nauticus]|jgi:hypothetical protein|uniref:Uncharacterized protein n=1 Tax=Marinobacter nauticus TaxID=2743 RepID=A0A368V3F5_MARNT|nr:hypothetical protein DET64_104244 [Marinobacter nauticus]RCW35626.1 hypothetical protein DET51_104244 [Marinobacter nauticus]